MSPEAEVVLEKLATDTEFWLKHKERMRRYDAEPSFSIANDFRNDVAARFAYLPARISIEAVEESLSYFSPMFIALREQLDAEKLLGQGVEP